MKTMFIAAVALAFAGPVAAQTAAQPHAHQGHGQHQAQPAAVAPHTEHAAHAQHVGHGQAGGDHSQHANCCGEADGKPAMECCKGAQAAERPCCAKHSKANQGGATAPNR